MAGNERKEREQRSQSETRQGLQRSIGRSEPLFPDPFATFWGGRDPFAPFWDAFGLGQRSWSTPSERTATSGWNWSPQLEAFQRGNEYVVRVDLPGMKKDDVRIDVTDESITIEGERREEHEEDREGYYRSERRYGTFRRVVPLPEGALADTAKAHFNNGVLEIVVQAPPREVSCGRRLEIK
jgi:HSP20 family protein